MPAQTLYDLLCVRPNDDAETIQSAFRDAAKAHHPDLNPGDTDAPRRFRQIVTAYTILRDSGQRRAYDQLLALERARRRTMLPRAVISHAVAAGIFTFVFLTGGYTLLAHVSKSMVEESMAVAVAAQKPTYMTDVQPIGTKLGNRDQPSQQLTKVPDKLTTPNSATPRISADSAHAIADGRPAEINIFEPAASTDKSESNGQSARLKFAKVPIVRSAVAPEAKNNEPPIVANGGPAPASTESNSEVAKAVAGLSVFADLADTRNGANDDKQNDESTPLGQNGQRSVGPHLLLSKKDTSVTKSTSSDLAIFDEKHYVRTSRPRVRATRPTPDRMSVREAASESRTMSQIALESRTTWACAGSCSKRPPPLFGVGF